MKNLRNLILMLLCMSVARSAFGQTIDSYRFSLQGSPMPGGGSRGEVYFKKKCKRKHTVSERRYDGSKLKRKHKQRRLKNHVPIENAINSLDSLFRLTAFTFTINKSMIDSIKAHNNWHLLYRISSTDIHQFFSRGDTVTLSLHDIKPEETAGMVIDGYPYVFDLVIRRSQEDTIKYKFHGNFHDRVQTSNIRYWLPVYLAYRQHKFFETMPMEAYFTDKNLELVLMRFIEWTK